MSIPGIPGATEPTFQTRDRRFVSLDRIVNEVCARLEEDGDSVSLGTAKATIQVARHLVCAREVADGEELSELVSQRLRGARILLTPALVGRLMRAYGELVMELDIAETMEFTR